LIENVPIVPIEILHTVPIEIIPQVEHKKQPRNTKLPPEVAVTATQAYHDAMSDKTGTYFHSNTNILSY
jgi:hypothetical protein